MVYAVNYKIEYEGMYINACVDPQGGYVFVLSPTFKPLRVGGDEIPRGTCKTVFYSRDLFKELGVHTINVAEAGTDAIKAKMTANITSSTFPTQPPPPPPPPPPPGGQTYDCIGGSCQPVAGGRYTDPGCQGACAAPPPPPPPPPGGGGTVTCPTGQMNLMGSCIQTKYVLYGGVGFLLLMMLRRK